MSKYGSGYHRMGESVRSDTVHEATAVVHGALGHTRTPTLTPEPATTTPFPSGSTSQVSPLVQRLLLNETSDPSSSVLHL